jgi:hypothetical protein
MLMSLPLFLQLAKAWLTNTLQWKAGTDWYESPCYSNLNSITRYEVSCRIDKVVTILTHRAIEYALNAVNQGITALGIKGMCMQDDVHIMFENFF